MRTAPRDGPFRRLPRHHPLGSISPVPPVSCCLSLPLTPKFRLRGQLVRKMCKAPGRLVSRGVDDARVLRGVRP